MRWIGAVLSRVGLLFVSLLVCLGLVEATLRMTMEFKPELGLNEVDAELGHRMKPNFRGERHYGVPVETNSWGMRDREFTLEKPAGTLRILALGDSWTAGLGVFAEETWPKRVETLLQEKRAEGTGAIEVMNTGVSGYETHHEAVYYRRDLAQFEHDLVLVGLYPVNDVNDKRRRIARHQALRDIHPLVYAAYMFPRRHLYVHHWYSGWQRERKLRRRAETYLRNAASAPDETPAALWFPRPKDDWTQLYTDRYRGWRRMKVALASIGETAREVEVPGVVILFPDLRDLTRYDAYCHPRVRPLIEAAVADAELHLVDLADDFRPWVGRETELGLGGNIGASHPSALGHDLIARAVVRELEARELIDVSALPMVAEGPEDEGEVL